MMAGRVTTGPIYGVPVQYQSGVNRQYTVPEVFAFLTGAGFTKEQAKVMTAIAHRESGYNDHARNPVDGTQSDGRVAVGMWQNMVTFTSESALSYLYDPKRNAKASHDKFVSSVSHGATGYAPWGFASDADAQKFAGSSQAFVTNPGISGYDQTLLKLDPSKLNPITGWVGDLLRGLADFAIPVGVAILGVILLLVGFEWVLAGTKMGKQITGVAKSAGLAVATDGASAVAQGAKSVASKVTSK